MSLIKRLFGTPKQKFAAGLNPNRQLQDRKCPNCGKRATVAVTSRGTWRAACPHCKWSACGLL